MFYMLNGIFVPFHLKSRCHTDGIELRKYGSCLFFTQHSHPLVSLGELVPAPLPSCPPPNRYQNLTMLKSLMLNGVAFAFIILLYTLNPL